MINSAIVGCGNIGGFLDTPSSENIVTHAHAYTKHHQTSLIACCDPNINTHSKFCDTWGTEINAYENLEEMLENELIQMLSICSPTAFHAHNLKLALNQPNIETIICEKPFVQTLDEFNELSHLLNHSSKKIIINFMRQFDPSIRKLKQLIESKQFGKMKHFHALFTKGLYHNGSHMLELIEHLCGNIDSISTCQCEMYEDDLYGSFYLQTKNARGTISNEYDAQYAIFELELMFTKAKVNIKNSGHKVEIQTTQPSKHYKGYFNLELEQTLEDTMKYNLYNSVDFVINNNTNDVLKKHLNLSQKLLDIKSQLYDKKSISWSNQ
jgi:predicted dehydrogenase